MNEREREHLIKTIIFYSCKEYIKLKTRSNLGVPTYTNLNLKLPKRSKEKFLQILGFSSDV